MDVERFFHMKGGIGDNSYAKNSSYQKKAADMVKHITIEAIQEVYQKLAPNSLGIADLGCSSGPNTLSFVKNMVEAVEISGNFKAMCQPPEFRLYLNDLFTNDFNSIFKSLPDLYEDLRKERGGNIFVAGYPGSFYGRLFPSNCLHFVYSSYSLHWLSKVPPALYDGQGKSINRGTIHISDKSPPLVPRAYHSQFQEDFSLFLRSRSEELVSGGRMVLILLGRLGPDHIDRGNSFYWELLSRSFAVLVSQGVIEQEKLDLYDVHFYAPSKDEIEEEIIRNGTFEIDRLDLFETESDTYRESQSYGADVAMTVRAIQEPMISQHFGEQILDALFDIYGRMVDEEMAKEEMKAMTILTVLRKL